MNNKLILEFYYLALADIRHGASVEELEEAIELYEKEENYEACAGILKALNETKYQTIKDIENGQRDD